MNASWTFYALPPLQRRGLCYQTEIKTGDWDKHNISAA